METPLLKKLLDCAVAIEKGNLNLADSLIKDILMANETEDATAKLVKYFAEALVRRVYALYPRYLLPLTPSSRDLCVYMDFQFSPFFWFAQTLAHRSFMDALIGKESVHLIDFSFMLSSWSCHTLIKRLAHYHGALKSFRLTIIGPMMSKHESLEEIISKPVGRKAQDLGVDFEMRAFEANYPADIVAAALHLERISEEETIIVNWGYELHKLLPLPRALDKVLSKLRDLKPEIMVIAEQEASHNGPNFLDWLPESYQYYSIVFESLHMDTFKDIDHCKVLWEMYFRRQIGNILAQDINHIERHEKLVEWQNRLCRAGFRPFRLFNGLESTLFEDNRLPQYVMLENNLHPQLCRNYKPLAVLSIWKPDPAHVNESVEKGIQEGFAQIDGSSRPLIGESERVSDIHLPQDLFNVSHHPILISERKIWSSECFSINRIAAAAQIFDMLEYISHVYVLPLALTWISDGNTNSEGKQTLHIEKRACYIYDLKAKRFVEACGEQHLQEGQGIAGKTLLSNSLYFESDVSKLPSDVYPFVRYAWEFGLRGVVAIKLSNKNMSSIDYVLEFFLPSFAREISFQNELINVIVAILKKNLSNSWEIFTERLSGDNMRSEVGIEEVGTSSGTQAVVFGSSPLVSSYNMNNANVRNMALDWLTAAALLSPTSELSEIDSSNSHQIRELCKLFKSICDGTDVPEPRDQELEEQNSTFEDAAPCPNNEKLVIESSYLNTGTTNKRRRTSEVWQSFYEIRENGEVWAKCKGCASKYRGESTRGTTNLRKHLRSCPGKKKDCLK